MPSIDQASACSHFLNHRRSAFSRAVASRIAFSDSAEAFVLLRDSVLAYGPRHDVRFSGPGHQDLVARPHSVRVLPVPHNRPLGIGLVGGASAIRSTFYTSARLIEQTARPLMPAL